jgi:hypothetical protein
MKALGIEEIDADFSSDSVNKILALFANNLRTKSLIIDDTHNDLNNFTPPDKKNNFYYFKKLFGFYVYKEETNEWINIF